MTSPRPDGGPAPLLITSFQTWLPHQPSNSSDDLLALLQRQHQLPPHCHLLRHLPVEVDRAFALVQAHLDRLQPAYVLCCGMAEGRSHLSLEAQATGPDGSPILTTPLPLPALLAHLPHTILSYDAGRFVCNGLYFRVLDYCAQPSAFPLPHGQIQALFIHVPVLTAENQTPIAQDLATLIQHLSTLPHAPPPQVSPPQRKV